MNVAINGIEDNNIHGSEEMETVELYHSKFNSCFREVLEKTEARLGMIAKIIGYEQDMSASRKKVCASLEPMNWLSVEDKLIAASSITSRGKNLDLFFNVPDEDKENLVNVILAGRI
ncbi:hypothetical protein ACH5RR_002580 [Cinchona calisaya]|uniref:Uncharacterized protein n=1 Tax=Cinchona calisaya TaxID=153742 RepID=A0ABD3ASC9_9GENT